MKLTKKVKKKRVMESVRRIECERKMVVGKKTQMGVIFEYHKGEQKEWIKVYINSNLLSSIGVRNELSLIPFNP